MMQDSWFKLTSTIGKKFTESPAILKFMDTLKQKIDKIKDLIDKFTGTQTTQQLTNPLKQQFIEAKKEYRQLYIEYT